MDLGALIDFTEASAEKILVVSLLVIMVAYVLNVMFTATKQGIGLTSQSSDIDPTTLPCVPEEVLEAVEAEDDEDEGEEGDETKED